MIRYALKAEVERLSGKPVVWGSDDCSTWPAQWVSTQTGKTFAWPDYASAEEAEAIIAQCGGLEHIWRDVAREIGLREHEADERPQCGDVGLVTTRTAGVVGGVFAEWGAFCWRCERGVRFLPARMTTVVASWEVSWR